MMTYGRKKAFLITDRLLITTLRLVKILKCRLQNEFSRRRIGAYPK